MFVGSFEGDFVQFQTDTVSAFNGFKKAGVSQVLIDLTNNGGEHLFIVHKEGFGTDKVQVGSSVWDNSYINSLPGHKLVTRKLVALCTEYTCLIFLQWFSVNDEGECARAEDRDERHCIETHSRSSVLFSTQL